MAQPADYTRHAELGLAQMEEAAGRPQLGAFVALAEGIEESGRWGNLAAGGGGPPADDTGEETRRCDDEAEPATAIRE